MTRLVKDFIEIENHSTLEGLIARLSEVREALPAEAQPEVRMRGDDVFGRHICISFFRPQTAEEAACDARYADAYRESRQREMGRLQDELGFCPVPELRRSPRLHAVG
jgi:hypothetical protein